ncbi:DNA topoisomerase IV subunit A [Fundicoccus culcitae]|uniref:DNA topoisomerase 4 subunit A n=1 Tax=Fundicoccus culcitae TaxID=2969821 RepID=A0ABY5P765_9LACT|nr:DNA topoisomerase IV subunit A [Fundicoccus culcitae]UUX34435.1 DNA topoisomerase IV subunit A [Fundicoccus culcitae]
MSNEIGVQELGFASVIGDRFGRYSKYIIQDRALPDIRDGLKPVQRRILFAMFQERNTAENPYRKSAKTVGNVIGNYHPHGDSSVYEAMVRMSQDWKLRYPLIDMHGNNGSMDGDPAAAMRYTEARLSPIAGELLRDLKSQTVDYLLNFDDTLEEPSVLPARVPNLLINGATGISAGYATEIPPHNLTEVLDAIIYMLSHKRYDIDKIMTFIKGPDFPTGGIIQGKNDIKKAYQKGHGKIIVRAVTDIEELKGNKSQIVVTELPYDVNKSKLIQRLDDIRIQKKIDGIAEVRDESDRNGVRLVIELRREINANDILNYLFKNSDLQINYHLNMVAINHRRPEVVSLIQILEAYIDHQREIIRRRTAFNLKRDQERLHIVEGLIRVVSILDEVIASIRASENKADAKNNLAAQFDFSLEQAEAIVSLQLYRLTNTDIVALQNEKLELNEQVLMYQNILNNDETLNKVLSQELKELKNKYKSDRRTKIEDEVQEITVATSLLIPKETVNVSITKEGYIKRTSVRSFTSSDTMELASRDFDYPLFVRELTTHDQLVILTNKGNYIHLPVHELPDIRWKEIGRHLSQYYQLEANEQVVNVFVAADDIEGNKHADESDLIVLASKKGKIKQTPIEAFTTYRSYKTKTAVAMKLAKNDEIINAYRVKADVAYEVIILTERSYAIRYDLAEVAVSGLKTQGVVSINLKADDTIISVMFDQANGKNSEILALTQRGNLKHFKTEIIPQVNNRNSRGLLMLKELKQNPHRFVDAHLVEQNDLPFIIQGDTGETIEVMAKDIALSDRLSNGSTIKNIDSLGQVVNFHPAHLKMLTEDK